MYLSDIVNILEEVCNLLEDGVLAKAEGLELVNELRSGRLYVIDDLAVDDDDEDDDSEDD